MITYLDIFRSASLHLSKLVSLHCLIKSTFIDGMFGGGLAKYSRSARKARAAVRIGRSRNGFAMRESMSSSSARLTMSTKDRADYNNSIC